MAVAKEGVIGKEIRESPVIRAIQLHRRYLVKLTLWKFLVVQDKPAAKHRLLQPLKSSQAARVLQMKAEYFRAFESNRA